MKPISIISKLGGIIQIIGGLLSIYGLYKSSFNQGYQIIPSLITVIPFILLNLVSGLAILITKRQWGALILLINYMFQTIQIELFGFYYFFAVGPYLGIGIVRNQVQGLTFWFDTSEFAFINIMRQVIDKENFFLTFNLVAITFLVILYFEFKNRSKPWNKLENVEFE